MDPVQALKAEMESTIAALKARLDEMNTRLTESERTNRAFARAVKEAEKKSHVQLMPEGTYYGIRFA